MPKKRTSKIAPVMTAHALLFLNELELAPEDRQRLLAAAARIARRRGNERIARADVVTANYERCERAARKADV